MESTGRITTEMRIRAAVAQIAGDEWASLRAVRAMVSAPREQVDEALREMYRQPDVMIAAQANQKVLGAADHEAAVRIGGEDRHLIQIIAEQDEEGWW